MPLDEKKFPVCEMFGPTIQGEGGLIGQQTYFIRFGGCDFKCKMCDSMHAVDPKQIKANAEYLTSAELLGKFLDKVYKTDTTTWVTLSGGNPAIHDLAPIINYLQMQGFRVHMETQGSVWAEWMGLLDALTISPKGPAMIDDQQKVVAGVEHILRMLNALTAPNQRPPHIYLKFVVFDQRDLDFTASTMQYLTDNQLAGWYSSCIPTNNVYLSLGDDAHEKSYASQEQLIEVQLQRYLTLLEDIQGHYLLSGYRFLPRLHVLLWGNEKGR